MDCGISNKLIPTTVKYILLTHDHGDHFYPQTVSNYAIKWPDVAFIVPPWLEDNVKRCGVTHYRLCEMNKWYGLPPNINVRPFQLYHDRPNCGWRIIINGNKIFHATDTRDLEGLTAKDYDIFALEMNYDEQKIKEVIEKSKQTGEFSHALGVPNSHLSVQQAEAFYYQNRKGTSQLIPLHQSTSEGHL